MNEVDRLAAQESDLLRLPARLSIERASPFDESELASTERFGTNQFHLGDEDMAKRRMFSDQIPNDSPGELSMPPFVFGDPVEGSPKVRICTR